MFSNHHYQVDTKSDPLAIEGQDWQIAQNIPPSLTLSHENSFSHFTATDECFSDFKTSSFDEASGLSLTLPELPRIPQHFAKLLVPLAVFLYLLRSRNQHLLPSRLQKMVKSTRTSEKEADQTQLNTSEQTTDIWWVNFSFGCDFVSFFKFRSQNQLLSCICNQFSCNLEHCRLVTESWE